MPLSSNVTGNDELNAVALQAEFRFYAELNDFLSPERRHRSFVHECARRATVKHAIEALGVPHTEVEIVLVNGESVSFGRVIRARDRVSVYPQFETLDISPLLRVRPEPLRITRFLADAHLGALARYLRMLGFDTVCAGTMTDRAIVSAAAEERRIILTRDRDLLMHKTVSHGCHVRATNAQDQLVEIVSRLDLYRSAKPFSRCMECNGWLAAVDKADVRGRLPNGTDEYYDDFSECERCRKIYWPGSHQGEMQRLINRIMEGLR